MKTPTPFACRFQPFAATQDQCSGSGKKEVPNTEYTSSLALPFPYRIRAGKEFSSSFSTGC